MFLGSFYPWTAFFIIKTPKRHLLMRKHAFWALIGRSYGVTWRSWQEYKKGNTQKLANIRYFRRPPSACRTATKCCTGGVISRMYFFDGFSFRKIGWKMWELWGGRNFGLPIDQAHRFYNSLLLPHKPRQSILWRYANVVLCLNVYMTEKEMIGPM